MDTKYLKNVFLYILSALLAIGIGYYVLYHVFDGFSSALATAPATLTTESETYSGEAYIFRNEKIVYSRYSGAVNYLVTDGEKVGVGASLAEVYQSGERDDLRERVLALDEKIELFEASNIDKNIVVSDTSKIDTEISELYYSAMAMISDGELSYALYRKDDMLSRINKRKIIVGEVKNYDTQIAALTAERAALTALLDGSFEKIYSPSSGYFFFDVDGYEHAYSSEKLGTMSLADFEEAFASQKETAGSGKTAIGKMIYGYTWHIAVPVDSIELTRYEVGKKYSVTFPYNYDTTVKMTLERTVSENGKAGGVLVFSATDMPEDFNYMRTQSVTVERNSVTGYRVPVSAVRIVDGKQGVYILYGSTVYFRRVDVLIEKDGYFIVAERDPSREDAAEYLGVADTVITRGKDLFDGKIIG